MKSTIEYTEAEFIALLTLAEKITDRIFARLEQERNVVPDYTYVAPSPVPDVDSYVASTVTPKEENEFGFNQSSGRMKDMPVPQDTPIKGGNAEVVVKGHQVMASFIERWEKNLGVQDAEQPDRVEMMREIGNGPNAGAILMYLSEKGGLLHGIDAIVNLNVGEDETSRRARVNLIGTTMCQIGSIFFPDIAQMYEHVDIYRKRKVKG
jgi:hypothetical protein